jgi:hypothetical protein
MNLSILKVLEKYDSIVDIEQDDVESFVRILNYLPSEPQDKFITISSEEQIIFSTTTYRRRYISGYDGIKVCHKFKTPINVRIDKNNLISMLQNYKNYNEIQFYIKDKTEFIMYVKMI